MRRSLDGQQTELLRVTAKLGNFENKFKKDRFIAGEKCLDGLKDICRFLRRDDPRYRRLHRALGEWNVVQKQVLPLLIQSQDNPQVLFEATRLLVMVTMPVDPESEVEEMYRDNDILKSYAEAFASYEGNVIATLVGMLEKPLSRVKTEGQCTERDEIVFELVLTLFRNLLDVTNETSHGGTTGAHRTELHENLMKRFESEFVMDMLIAIVDAIGAGFFSKYNLLTLELVHLVLRGYDPKAVVLCANDKSEKKKSTNKKQKQKRRSDHFGSMMANDIRQRKQREAQLRGRRHARFGGVLKLSMFGGMFLDVGASHSTHTHTHTHTGTAQAVTTAPLSEVMRNPNQVLQKQQPKARRATRAVRQQFEESVLATRLLGSDAQGVAMPVPHHVAKMLAKLCDSMIDGGGFLLLVKSLQKEFRNIAAGRVMPSDQLKLLHVLWFCTRYRRVVVQKLKKKLPPAIPGILTKWLFVFVVKCCQVYDPSAKSLSSSWGALGLSVALLTEILASLNAMVTSKNASNHAEGVKLQRIIFYDADLIYTLQSLLSTWDERKVGIPHLSHLVHSTHLILKCAERFAQGGEDAVMLSKRVRRRKKLKKKEEEEKKSDEDGESKKDVGDESEKDEESKKEESTTKEDEEKDGESKKEEEDISKKKEEEQAPPEEKIVIERYEKYFDLVKFQQDFMTNKILRNYCILLSQYRTNSVQINHYVTCYLRRMCDIEIKEKCGVTMETSLWQVSILTLFDRILSDPCMKGSVYHNLRSLIRQVTRNFLKAAQDNPLVFVEALFWRTKNENKNLYTHYDIEQILNEGYIDEEDQDENVAEEEWIERALKRKEKKKKPSDDSKSSGEDSDDDDESSDSEEELDLDLDNDDDDHNDGEEQVTKRVGNDEELTTPWTAEEDEKIREQWEDVKDMESRCQVLCLEDVLQANERTPEQVSRHLVKLGLVKRSRRASTGLKLRRNAIRECVRRLEKDMQEKEEEESYEEIIEWITKSLGNFLMMWRKKKKKKKQTKRAPRKKKEKTISDLAYERFCGIVRDDVIEEEDLDSLNMKVNMPKGPKRSQSAYMFFCAAKREELKEDEPGLNGSRIMKRLGALWKELEDKSTYEELATQDKTRYQNELEIFREDKKEEIEEAEKLKLEIQDQKKRLETALRKKWTELSEKDRKKYHNRVIMEKSDEEEEEEEGDFDPDYPDLPSKSRMIHVIKEYIKNEEDLAEITTKSIRKRLEKHFGVSLRPLKRKIKDAVTKLLMETCDVEEEVDVVAEKEVDVVVEKEVDVVVEEDVDVAVGEEAEKKDDAVVEEESGKMEDESEESEKMEDEEEKEVDVVVEEDMDVVVEEDVDVVVEEDVDVAVGEDAEKKDDVVVEEESGKMEDEGEESEKMEDEEEKEKDVTKTKEDEEYKPEDDDEEEEAEAEEEEQEKEDENEENEENTALPTLLLSAKTSEQKSWVKRKRVQQLLRSLLLKKKKKEEEKDVEEEEETDTYELNENSVSLETLADIVKVLKSTVKKMKKKRSERAEKFLNEVMMEDMDETPTKKRRSPLKKSSQSNKRRRLKKRRDEDSDDDDEEEDLFNENTAPVNVDSEDVSHATLKRAVDVEDEDEPVRRTKKRRVVVDSSDDEDE